MPEVSIIIPTYNRPHLLERALCSVMQQTFTDFEVIVVNDAGCDVGKSVRQFSQIPIKLINLDKNSGSSIARNNALEVAQGKYIAYLDDDDIFYPEHIQCLYTTSESNSYDFVYSKCVDVSEDSQGQSIIKNNRFFPPYHPSLIKRINFIPICCVFHSRLLLNKTGFFDPDIWFAEDWEMWFRMSLTTDFHHLPKVTCEYRKNILEDSKNAQSKTLQNNQAFANLLYEKYNIVTDIRKIYPTIPNSVIQHVAEYFKNSTLYLYGAGTYFEQIIPAIENNVTGVFDANAPSIKSRIKKQYGVDVLPLEQIATIPCVPILSTVIDRVSDVLQSIYSHKANVEDVYFIDDFFDL